MSGPGYVAAQAPTGRVHLAIVFEAADYSPVGAYAEKNNWRVA